MSIPGKYRACLVLLLSLSWSYSGIASAATVNSPPTISGVPAASVAPGSLYWFRPAARDADGDALKFSISGKPSWAYFSSRSGVLTGFAGTSHAGLYSNIVISVSDGRSTTKLAPFAIQVGSGNRAPTISGSPPAAVVAGAAYAFLPVAGDPDGNALSFSIGNKPAWAAFDALSGALRGTPLAAHCGTYSNITISVSDGVARVTLAPFSVQVTQATGNRTPVISGTPATTVAAGAAYSFVPSASDADGNALTFSVANKPSWATFNASNGALSGTPATTQAGAYSGIVISVSDGTVTAALPAFAINVTTAANRAPTIAGSPPTQVAAGATYTFQPSASDPDGNKLTYGISGRPAWAAFDTTTGALTGTPTAAQAGTYSNIQIGVTDGTLNAVLPPFSIVVAASNRAPVISGTPATSVAAGSTYSFTPAGSDPDGNTIAFGIANKPAWATFSTATGTLAGTPSSAQAATYPNIVISVSDGTLNATLPAFAIVVSPLASTGTATLSWTPPTQNSDGTPLTNLAGYHLRYGSSPSALTNAVTLDNAGLATYVITNLASGTWYFALTAYNALGEESDMSGVVSKLIP